MTQATPPGWYPDPGQTNDGPATERWWDGTAWTDQVRPTGSAPAWAPPAPGTAAGPAHPAYPAYPAHPGYPTHPGYPGVVQAGPGSGRGRGLRIGIAVAAAVAVLASIGVGVYALTDDGGSGGASAASQAPGGRGGGPEGPEGGPDEDGPGQDTSEPPRVESGSVTDGLSGISLPIPDGWYGQEGQVGAQIMSENTYDCPGDTSSTCTKGGAYSAPAQALGSRGSTAEAVAKADISANAEESYGGDSYGRISSHEVLESKAVTVAGQKGYLVRWKAVTSKGSDGYVQSLAFPSPARPGQMVVVRFGLDADQKQSVLDDITEGIEKAESGGRGNGQDV
ncbi:DUF2510 domain-containing protein [Streptomyces sp. MAR25Y5]|uniref:DUF2510 domain-containing protein n=1 Tax=Streptomyces sp. MAR25Y5 TaxID=2962028 RepID=UPI0020B7B580|nr:DUF2510 domain-containing protein [Streptomyces sp. MAR25Y5]MCP3767762.1 DUF2510 domain-containing protein [Streptomyces sp. MAR25Y5]